MQRYKPFLYTAIGLMAVLIAFNTGIIVQRKKTSSAVIEYESEKQFAESKIRVLETYFMLSVRSNGKTIEDYVLFTDIENNIRSAAEIFSSQVPCLVFRYTYTDCTPCINTVFDYLQILRDSVDEAKLRIVVMPYYAERGQMVVENAQSFKNQFPFYLAAENGIGLPIDASRRPYLFMIDEDKQVSNVFVIDTMFSSLLDRYIKFIIEDFE